MIERLQLCEQCKVRAHCEFFKPGEICYIDERIDKKIFSSQELTMKKMELNVGLLLRTNWGGGLKKRKKKLDKDFVEVDEKARKIIKEERECHKTSNDLESGEKEKTLQ